MSAAEPNEIVPDAVVAHEAGLATRGDLRVVRAEMLALSHRYVIIGSVAFVLLAGSVGVEVLRSQIAIDTVRQDARALAVVNAAIARQEAIAKTLVKSDCLAGYAAARILRLTIASKVAIDIAVAKVDESGIPNAPNPQIAAVLRDQGRLFRERAVIDGSEAAAYASRDDAPCVVPAVVK